MSDRGPAGDYSTEEINRLLQRIRAEHQSAQSSPGSAARPGDPAKASAERPGTGSASQSRGNADLGVTPELSVEEILTKIRREIAEEDASSAPDNQSSWTTTVHRQTR